MIIYLICVRREVFFMSQSPPTFGFDKTKFLPLDLDPHNLRNDSPHK